MTGATKSDIGARVREWRELRRLSQLELSLEAGVSSRHLSFVETGRSKPGREMLMRVLRELDVPFRERNQLLLAAGHAPAFAQHPLDHPELAPVRDALDLALTGHEPYPAIVVDRGWNLVAANSGVLAVTQGIEIDPELLDPPLNAVRLSLHPGGLAPIIVNIGAWRTFFRERLERQLALTGDRQLAELIAELDGYADADGESGDQSLSEGPGPLKLRAEPHGELSFFGMFASFDAPFEVTTSELAIELLFPADGETARALALDAATRMKTTR
jgi:transcriptional regulator with XRE-family HTH domain